MLAIIQCGQCAGCGKIANTTDGEPWSAWENLPPGADLMVKLGMVFAIPCPFCQGKGHRAALGVSIPEILESLS
jgi:hypothetical protein